LVREALRAVVAHVDVPLVHTDDLDLPGLVGHREARALGEARDPPLGLLDEEVTADDRHLVGRIARRRPPLEDVVLGRTDVGELFEERLQHLRIVVDPANEDRKSTRLNSSHVKISYAVFCLKKKTYR